MYNAIVDIIEDDPTLYLDCMVTEIANKTGIHVSINYVSKLLKKKNYTLKTIERRAMRLDAEDMQRFLDEIATIENADQIVMLDESRKDKNSARRRRAWSKKGKKAVLREFFGPSDFTINYTLLACADVNGSIEEACDIVIRDGTPDGNVDGARFLEYIENHVLPIMQRYDPNNPLPRSVLIMDNAPVHMKEAIEALLEPTGCRIIYTAKYAPFLHPIERMFNQYKSCLKRLDRQMDDLYEKHVLCLQSVSPQNVRNYICSQCGEGLETFLTPILETINNLSRHCFLPQ